MARKIDYVRDCTRFVTSKQKLGLQTLFAKVTKRKRFAPHLKSSECVKLQSLFSALQKLGHLKTFIPAMINTFDKVPQEKPISQDSLAKNPFEAYDCN